MSYFLEWAQRYMEVIQALTSVVLVILTAIYIRYTSILAHGPFNTLVMPKKIRADSDSFGWQITLYNTGPGMALKVKLTTIAATNKMQDLKKEGYYWLVEDWCTADGPYAINPNEQKEFLIKYLLDFDKPFFIQWETQTGKKKKNVWKILIDSDDKVVGLSRMDEFKFRIKWIWGSIKTVLKVRRIKQGSKKDI